MSRSFNYRGLTTLSNTALNLVNLILRDTVHRVQLLSVDEQAGEDPEIYVVTRFDWRMGRDTPYIVELPRLLSLLESLRQCKGTPTEVYLDSTEGVPVYLPTGVTSSQVPQDSKQAVRALIDLVHKTVQHNLKTVHAVEHVFWSQAKRMGYSPQIVTRMVRKEPGFAKPGLMSTFIRILRRYFTVRFTIHRAESRLMVEGRQ